MFCHFVRMAAIGLIGRNSSIQNPGFSLLSKNLSPPPNPFPILAPLSPGKHWSDIANRNNDEAAAKRWAVPDSRYCARFAGSTQVAGTSGFPSGSGNPEHAPGVERTLVDLADGDKFLAESGDSLLGKGDRIAPAQDDRIA